MLDLNEIGVITLLLVSSYFVGTLPAPGTLQKGRAGERLAFLLEVLKGVIPVIFILEAQYLPFGDAFRTSSVVERSDLWAWSVGCMAALGQAYPVWSRVKGRKGLEPAFGALLVLAPVSAVAAVVGYVLALSRSHAEKDLAQVEAYLVAILLAVITGLVVYPIRPELFPALAILILLLFRLEPEIDDLLEYHEKTT